MILLRICAACLLFVLALAKETPLFKNLASELQLSKVKSPANLYTIHTNQQAMQEY
jgi:hypothetical protein